MANAPNNDNELYAQIQATRTALQGEAKKLLDLGKVANPKSKLYRQSKQLYEQLTRLNARLEWVQRP